MIFFWFLVVFVLEMRTIILFVFCCCFFKFIFLSSSTYIAFWALVHTCWSAACVHPLVGLGGGSPKRNESLVNIIWLPKINTIIKRLRDSDQDTDTDYKNESFLNTSANWPRFLVVESASVDLPLSKLFPFAIQKGFQAIAGTLKSINRLRDGSFLVECARKRKRKSPRFLSMQNDHRNDWQMGH